MASNRIKLLGSKTSSVLSYQTLTEKSFLSMNPEVVNETKLLTVFWISYWCARSYSHFHDTGLLLCSQTNPGPNLFLSTSPCLSQATTFKASLAQEKLSSPFRNSKPWLIRSTCLWTETFGNGKLNSPIFRFSRGARTPFSAQCPGLSCQPGRSIPDCTSYDVVDGGWCFLVLAMMQWFGYTVTWNPVEQSLSPPLWNYSYSETKADSLSLLCHSYLSFYMHFLV